jgi:hypothetical protein
MVPITGKELHDQDLGPAMAGIGDESDCLGSSDLISVTGLIFTFAACLGSWGNQSSVAMRSEPW